MNLSKLISTNPNINLIKEYSTFLLLFPTVIAGFYQFGMLISIDSDLIKFFSVSSLAKDGILYTFQCLILFVISYAYRVLITRYIYKKYKKYLNYTTNIAFLIGLPLLVISKYFVLENYAFFMLMLSGFFYLNNAIFFKKDILSVGGIYIGQTFMILIINFTLAQFHKNGIKNINQIVEKVKLKYDKSELLYYNDEYLFFTLKKFNSKDMKKDILVIKMDEIFNSDFQAK